MNPDNGDAEWLRIWRIVERYMSEVDVLDPAELTNLLTTK